jgi:hypothetical protein
MINRYDYKATIDCAKEEGIEIGVIKTTKSMLAEGLDPALIARITKLPKKQILAMR